MVKESTRNKSPSRNDVAVNSSKTKPSESRIKTKSPSRSSPSRTKSPSRSSPARTKSPSRTKKTKQEQGSPAKKATRKKSPARIPDLSKKATVEIIKLDDDFSASDEEYVPKEKPKAAVRGRTRKTDMEELIQQQSKMNNENSFGIRRITRNYAAQEERIVHLKSFDKKWGEFSDEDELTKPTSTASKSEKSEKISFGEQFGIVFQMIFSPAFVYALFLFCTKTQCSFRTFPDFSKTNLVAFFFELRSLFGYFAFVILLAILSVIPFTGRKIVSLPSKQEKFIYVTNGFPSSIFIIGSLCVLQYFQFNTWKFINDHMVHFLTSMFILSIIVSIYLYVRSFYVNLANLNPSEVGKPFLSGFFYGREINPRLLNVLDLKLFFLRTCCITLAIANLAILIDTLNIDLKLMSGLMKLEWRPLLAQPTLLVLVAFHVIYANDYLVFEHRMLSSYYIQYEGFGFKTLVGTLLTPYFMVAQTKYVAEYNLRLSHWELAALVLVYLIGYIVYRLSNNQKDTFRRNPYGTSSANLDSIQTATGRKLICSGFWGFVRQPNILGDLMMHACLLRFGYNVPPVLGVWSIVLMLIERAMSAQVICKEKYGSAWEKYCQRVKYVLIPKIY